MKSKIPFNQRAQALPFMAGMPLSASGSACGKAIICGEHAVVYGARAIAMPLLSLKMTLRLTPRIGSHGGIHLYLGGRSVSDHMHAVVGDALEALEIPKFPMDIHGSSGILIGAGLGSSAALCIALIRTLAAATRRALDVGTLARLGNELEKRFHGQPSGLDTAVVAAEQVVTFRKGQAPTPIFADARSGPFRFALLDSGLRSSTRAMIELAKPYFTGRHGDTRIRAFDQIAQAVAKGLETSDVRAVAAGMNETGARLVEAGVSSEEMNELVSLARNMGALGAKLTGAGGGGCVLALLPSEEADRQLEALKSRLGADRVHEMELP